MTDQQIIRIEVRADHDGIRIDKVLRDSISDYSRTYLKELIEKGYVKIGGRIVDKSRFLVEKGQTIEVQLVPKKKIIATPKKVPLEIIYQDDWLAVVNKPHGMSTHPNPNTKEVTIADAALKYFGPDLPCVQGDDRPAIVHRLDRFTSGVMVLAKKLDAAHFLAAQFKQRTVEKEYRALVLGQLRFDSDYIEEMIGRDSQNPTRMAVVESGGKEAQTYYEVMERFDSCTYVRCRPKTGRTHQIRVHLYHLGHSIVGDQVYRTRGLKLKVPSDAVKPQRQFLHAYSLTFPHPVRQEKMTFEAPLPADMSDFLQALRREKDQSKDS